MNDVKRFKQLLKANNFIGILKSRQMSDVIDLSTLLTREPSVVLGWQQVASLLMLIEKSIMKDEITLEDRECLKDHHTFLSGTWEYFKDMPQKGVIINAIRVADKLREEDRGTEGESTSPETVE